MVVHYKMVAGSGEDEKENFGYVLFENVILL
jgi:hypothetical protein